MPRRPLMTLPGLGPLPPACLPARQRWPLATLRGLGTPLPPLAVSDELDRTAPIPLVRPFTVVAMRRPIRRVLLCGAGAPMPQDSAMTSEERRQEARMGKVRRFGYRAIAAVAVLSLAELVYLLVA